MRCKTCDYFLWNLKTRQCPECGSPFLPSQYEFEPNAVQFQCIHCGQAYYGNGEKGHLVPAEFDCVTCGAHVTMDEMVLTPAEGVDEERAAISVQPWLDRTGRGWVTRWLGTVGLAMVEPTRLMRRTPPRSSTAAAWGFAFVTNLLITLVAAVPWLASMAFIMFMTTAGRGGGPGSARAGGIAMLSALLPCGMFFLVGVVGSMLGLALWGLVSHGLLRLTGTTAFGIGRTYQALCYSAGANVGSAIPCVGGYFGLTWWVVSAVLAVREGQRVSGGRASLAVITPPVLMLAMVIAAYISSMVVVLSMANTMQAGASANMAPAFTQSVTSSFFTFVDQHNGRAPVHVAEAVADGSMPTYLLIPPSSGTQPGNVIVGGRTLDQVPSLRASEKAAIAKWAAAALPPNTVAHRLGDFVFTYHGIDLPKADPGLWVVIYSPDPESNVGAGPQAVSVGCADRSIKTFPPGAFAGALVQQNALRAAAGLPPLPDPATVLHSNPAVSAP